MLHAAAACPIFGRRSAHVHYLQPPVLLGIRPSQRARTQAMHLWLLDSVDYDWRITQQRRRRLLRFSCMLGIVAGRMSSINDKWGDHRNAAFILRRCLSLCGVNDLLLGSDDNYSNADDDQYNDHFEDDNHDDNDSGGDADEDIDHLYHDDDYDNDRDFRCVRRQHRRRHQERDTGRISRTACCDLMEVPCRCVAAECLYRLTEPHLCLTHRCRCSCRRPSRSSIFSQRTSYQDHRRSKGSYFF